MLKINLWRGPKRTLTIFIGEQGEDFDGDHVDKKDGENKPMEGAKDDPDNVGQQGDDVDHRAHLADCHID